MATATINGVEIAYTEEGSGTPVVFIHGRKAFKYRIDARQFLKRLEAGRR